MSIFNERLCLLKDRHQLNTKQLADNLEIPASTLANYLRNREPNCEVLIRIARYFNVSVDWLVGNSDVMHTDQNDVSEIIKSLSGCPVSLNFSTETGQQYINIQTNFVDALSRIYTVFARCSAYSDFTPMFEAIKYFSDDIQNFSVLFMDYLGNANISTNMILDIMAKAGHSASEVDCSMQSAALLYAVGLCDYKETEVENQDAAKAFLQLCSLQINEKYPNNKLINCINK